jgi:hypothetical protein
MMIFAEAEKQEIRYNVGMTISQATFLHPYSRHFKNCGLKNTEEHQRLMAERSIGKDVVNNK